MKSTRRGFFAWVAGLFAAKPAVEHATYTAMPIDPLAVITSAELEYAYNEASLGRDEPDLIFTPDGIYTRKPIRQMIGGACSDQTSSQLSYELSVRNRPLSIPLENPPKT
jgi:hypothetical protein